MDEKKVKQLHALRTDLESFLKTTVSMVNDFQGRIDAALAEPQPEANQSGVVVDYKTFSEVINALACAVESGDVGAQPIYEKLIAMGKAQSQAAQPVQEAESEPQQELKDEKDLPPFLKDLFDSIEADLLQHFEANERKNAVRNQNPVTGADADIERLIKKQFPGSEIKIIKSPAELFNLLNMLNKLQRPE